MTSPAWTPAVSAGEPDSTRETSRPVLDVEAERLGEVGGEVLDHDPDPPALHRAVLGELVHHRGRDVDGHCEADPDVPAGRPDDRGVDADQLAVQAHQRAARVARVDRGVGLDEVLVALDVDPAAPERADDPRRDGLPEPEGVADGDDEVADLQRVAVSHREGGESVGLDPEQRDVGPRIAAEYLGLEAAVVLERDRHRLGPGDDVVVGQHVAAFRIDDHTGARALPRPRRGVVRQVEEAAEERIAKQRVVALRGPGRDRDVDHRRGDVAEQRRKGRDPVAQRQRQRRRVHGGDW